MLFQSPYGSITPFLLPPLAFITYSYLNSSYASKKRKRLVPPHTEHVLIIGASAGVGHAIALEYAERGAKVCLVARREEVLRDVQAECIERRPITAIAEDKKDAVIVEAVDFTNADGMLKLRERLEKDWGRLDTLAVIAGVSALRPLLEIAGVTREDKSFAPTDCSLEGLQEGIQISNAAIQGNFTGPLVAALTFFPFLSRSSPSPSVLLLSSVAAVIPAPTRALYAASKSASLMLYQALAMEHPEIAFTSVLPGTIEGDFRASAVDGGPVREANPDLHGLKKVEVAKRSVQAVDAGERTIFMSGTYRWGHLLYWIIPEFVEKAALKKYNYSV